MSMSMQECAPQECPYCGEHSYDSNGELCYECGFQGVFNEDYPEEESFAWGETKP